MKLRPAHLVLVVLAIGAVGAAVAIYIKGLQGTVEDGPLLSYVALASSLFVVGVVLWAFVAYDSRRAARGKRPDG
ncbi:hypothetical protein DSM112329_02833 [Paraconexibacter sp. AEG42_29]|uniref:Uncharacterized protein n=1 Tax=Paraconexibacter sp. AEG42_29 TaxID=2997339 RepID=A0AAU7AWD3_9ACTN